MWVVILFIICYNYNSIIIVYIDYEFKMIDEWIKVYILGYKSREWCGIYSWCRLICYSFNKVWEVLRKYVF